MKGHGKILIQVGINDLYELVESDDIHKTTVHDIMRHYETLREVIRCRNAGAILLFSSILPLCEKCEMYYPYVYGINFALDKWCSKSKEPKRSMCICRF